MCQFKSFQHGKSQCKAYGFKVFPEARVRFIDNFRMFELNGKAFHCEAGKGHSDPVILKIIQVKGPGIGQIA